MRSLPDEGEAFAGFDGQVDLVDGDDLLAVPTASGREGSAKALGGDGVLGRLEIHASRCARGVVLSPEFPSGEGAEPRRWLTRWMDRTDPAASTTHFAEAARAVASDVLAPAAADVDRTGQIPVTHFTALAQAGLFGVSLDATPVDFAQTVEELSIGCLATTFVWLQHHGLVRRLASLAADRPDLAVTLGRMRSGESRAGIVQAGLLPGPPLLSASVDDEGTSSLSGFSPWCTGWGMVDELLVAARLTTDPDRVVWFMVPAIEQPGLAVQLLDLQAVNATATVSVRFEGLAVDPTRMLGTDDYAIVGHPAGRHLRLNGSLALGLSRRCVEAIDSLGLDTATRRADDLRHRIDDIRERLDTATEEAMPSARADAGLLAVDAAVASVVAHGARSAITGSASERAMREATFLLVFGSRPSIKQALLQRS